MAQATVKPVFRWPTLIAVGVFVVFLRLLASIRSFASFPSTKILKPSAFEEPS